MPRSLAQGEVVQVREPAQLEPSSFFCAAAGLLVALLVFAVFGTLYQCEPAEKESAAVITLGKFNSDTCFRIALHLDGDGQYAIATCDSHMHAPVSPVFPLQRHDEAF